MTNKLMQIIERHSIPEPNSGCWLWEKATKYWGYGVLTFEKKQYVASRAALIAHTGENPPNLYALHSCDTPLCVNPEHLRWGTLQENSSESSLKRRHKNSRKSLCHKGHEFTTVFWPSTGTKRRCFVCQNARMAQYQAEERYV